jgi:hypothetical protein
MALYVRMRDDGLAAGKALSRGVFAPIGLVAMGLISVASCAGHPTKSTQNSSAPTASTMVAPSPTDQPSFPSASSTGPVDEPSVDPDAQEQAARSQLDVSTIGTGLLDAVQKTQQPLSVILEETRESDALLDYFLRNGYARRRLDGFPLLTPFGERQAGHFDVGGIDLRPRGTEFVIGLCCKVVEVMGIEELDIDHLRVHFTAQYVLNQLGSAIMNDPQIVAYIKGNPHVLTNSITFPYDVPVTRFSDGWRVDI